MSKEHFDVEAKVGRAVPQRATVTIDRAARTITVRPFRSRDEFTLPLADVAEMVAFKVLQTRALENRTRRRVRRVNRGLLGGLR